MSLPHTESWEAELDRWLAPFLDLSGDVRRRPWLPAYLTRADNLPQLWVPDGELADVWHAALRIIE